MLDVTLNTGALQANTPKGSKWASDQMGSVPGTHHGGELGPDGYRFDANQTAMVREWLIIDGISFGEG